MTTYTVIKLGRFKESGRLNKDICGEERDRRKRGHDIGRYSER